MRAVQPAQLKPKEIGLFLDVDGTLLDIAPRPEAVVVTNGLCHDLAAAEHALDGALALVSGRPIAELDRLFAPLRLRIGGVHGAEIRPAADAPVENLAPGRLDEEAWQELTRLLGAFAGSYAENKKVSFAVHYPAGTDIAALKAALERFIRRMADHGTPLRLLAGQRVFEVQLRGFDKGRAIARFMTEPPFAGRTPVFIGDDDIDRAAFDVVLAEGGLAYSVGPTLPGLSGAFAGPEAVRAWLHGLGR
jgi:trehalose 6-phosphate phosphatase